MIHVHTLSIAATRSVVINSDDFLTRLLHTVKCLTMSETVYATG
jgi:hypothetical protein